MQRAAVWIAVAVLAIGAALRLRAYIYASSFWLDEAMYAINVLARAPDRLLDPLWYNQTVPVLYTAVHWVVGQTLGPSEYALRLPALVLGLALLPLAWWIARVLLGEWGGVAAAALAAFAPVLVHYSNQLRPYGTDAFFTVSVFAAAISVARAPDEPRRWLLLVLAGVIGIPFSLPVVFPLAGAGVALLLHPAIRAERRHQLHVVAISLFWLALFALLFFTVLRAGATDAVMIDIWEEAFLDPSNARLGERVRKVMRAVLPNALWDDNPYVPSGAAMLLIPLALVGVARLWRRNGAWAAMLFVGTGLAVVGAAFFRQYPLVTRTVVFVIPVTLLLVAAGIDGLTSWLRGRARVAALVALTAIIVAPAVLLGAERFREPRLRMHLRPGIEVLESRRAPGDRVYIGWGAAATYGHYTTDWSSPDTARLAWLRSRGEWVWRMRPAELGEEVTAARWLERPSFGHELFGAPPWFWDKPYRGHAWAEAEIARAKAPGVLWMVLAEHAKQGTPALLVAAARKEGADVEVVWETGDAGVYRVVFAAP